jgi:hypothetical protein
MKKLMLTFSFLSLAYIVNAQQWLGSTTPANNIYRTGDVTTINGNMSRITLGSAWGGAPLWGGAYLGMNLRRESSGLWSYLNNTVDNQGIVMHEAGGNLHFSFKSSSGGTSGTITDADVFNNIKFKMHHTGIFEVMKGDLQIRPNTHVSVALGAAWGGAGMDGTGYLGFNLTRDNVSVGNWSYVNNGGTSNGASVIYGNLDGSIVFSVKPSAGGGAGTLSDNDIMQNGKMRLTGTGKLVLADHAISGWGGIGTINYSSNNYRLFVETGILTEKVRVAIKTTPEWSDFVFADDYKLMPLKQLEEYINEEKHLPEVPSAEEVVKEGVDLGQMQAKLLQKVEELTLYVIQQQKEISKQQKEIDALKNQAVKSKKVGL